MDSTFAFLSQADRELLDEIVSRREIELWTRVRRSQSVSRADVAQLLITLSDEFLDHLDEDWEPTDYGKTVDRILRQINKVQIETWP
jgi:hypothetical protein